MTDTAETKEYTLEKECELRFEIESKTQITVELKSGFAELYGTELVKAKKYTFLQGAKFAVFSYQGCVLLLTGEPDVCYIARETPMIQYLNTHSAIEQMRTKAEERESLGPITMIVGPTDVGKSTVCRILLNYAVRLGHRPIFTDLDVGQGNLCVPGSVSSLLIERPASIEEGFAQIAPLVVHYGHKSPDANNEFYKNCISTLADITIERLKEDKRTMASGVIINTCGWIKGQGYQNIKDAANAFQVGIIIVLDQERLYNELLRDIDSPCKVVFLPKSGGVVERSQHVRAESRDLRIREYFYGSRSPLYPHSIDIKWSDMKLYKIGAPALPDSCMPLGMKATDNMTKLWPIQPGPSLVHHLLALSFAETAEQDVLKKNILGYVCV
jgi:polyribonucleotide 5'-hydroxyl-kinase